MLTNLNLDTLDIRRRDQRLKCMYRTVRGSIPALSTETFFRPQKQTKDTFSLSTFQTMYPQMLSNNYQPTTPDVS